MFGKLVYRRQPCQRALLDDQLAVSVEERRRKHIKPLSAARPGRINSGNDPLTSFGGMDRQLHTARARRFNERVELLGGSRTRVDEGRHAPDPGKYLGEQLQPL